MAYISYVDHEMDIRTFFATQDGAKSIDSVERAAAQESIDSIINFVHASPPQPSTAVHAYGWHVNVCD